MKRDEFSGFFGVLVATVGSAVGLGNLWRFPYLVGQNGGAAFILIYLAFVLVICLPIMISEFIIGRLSLIHISEPTRLLSTSYAVFCLKQKKKKTKYNIIRIITTSPYNST